MDVFKTSVGLTLICWLPVITSAETGEQMYIAVMIAPPTLLVGFALLLSALPKYIKRFQA